MLYGMIIVVLKRRISLALSLSRLDGSSIQRSTNSYSELITGSEHSNRSKRKCEPKAFVASVEVEGSLRYKWVPKLALPVRRNQYVVPR